MTDETKPAETPAAAAPSPETKDPPVDPAAAPAASTVAPATPEAPAVAPAAPAVAAAPEPEVSGTAQASAAPSVQASTEAAPGAAAAPSAGVMLAPTAPRKPQGVPWTLPLVVIALGSFGGLWAMYGSLLTHPTRAVPGEPTRFDPIAAYPSALEYAGQGAQLVSVAALYVGQDGTMDLTATPSPSPTAIYTFVRESKDPKATGANYETITVMVAEPYRTVSFGAGEENDTYVCRGMDRTVSHGGNIPAIAVPAPACPIAPMFGQALQRGAAPGALANVLYGPGGYSFTITSPRLSLQFGMDCKLKEPNAAPTP